MTGPTPVDLHLATTDPEEANEGLRQVFTRARMGTITDEASFLYRQDVQGDTDLNLGRLTFRGSIAGHMELEDVFSVVVPRSGGVDWRIDGQAGTGLGVFVVQPGQDYYGEVDRLEVDSVNLGLPALEETARAVYGDEDLTVSFDGPRPASAARERYWRSTYEFVHEILLDPSVTSVPLLRADLLRRMSVATLEAFALTENPRSPGTSVAARQRAYRRAVEYMRACRASPITVEDVARHVDLSTLELTRAFRSHAGTTPGAYLRDLRLTAAHEDLVRADPAEGGTAQDIARRWGIAHAADLARLHRQASGKHPGRGLHR